MWILGFWMRSFSETEKSPKSIIRKHIPKAPEKRSYLLHFNLNNLETWPLANQTSEVLMQYDHTKKITYCDNHTHQLKTTITYTKKNKTITFIGPVHHTHRNIFNINFYRGSTSHIHRNISNINFYRASTSHTHTHRNISNINFYRASTKHTHREISNKNFFGPVHHTHSNISKHKVL